MLLEIRNEGDDSLVLNDSAKIQFNDNTQLNLVNNFIKGKVDVNLVEEKTKDSDKQSDSSDESGASSDEDPKEKRR